MYKKDCVSIIIPFHNAEKYIRECIKCLKNQIYLNYEAIFIDDGSDDSSVDIIREYSDPRIKLISIQKSGVSTARNVGIQSARGEYITFWDIDDKPHPNFLSIFVEDICKYNVDTVISNYDDVFVGNNHIKINLPWENQIIKDIEIEDVLIPRMIYPLKNETTIRGLVWRTFTRTELFIKNNIFFEPDISMAEDLLFTIELYKCSKSIYVEGQSLYDYMRNSTSAMNTYSEKQIEKQIIFHKKFIAQLKKLNIYEKNKRRYEANRINMYSVSISNCVRNPDMLSKKIKKLKQIRGILTDDRINIFNSVVPIKIKVACGLLYFKMYRLLITIYTLKEKRRISRFN